MKKKIIFRLVLASLALPLLLPAAVQSLGTPILRNYSVEEYQASPQNWAICQDARGIMYVANNAVILEFDGSQWRSFFNANKSRNRSLGLGPDGRVYVGGVGDFGFLAPNDLGETHYVSLLPQLPLAERKFDDVWDIVVAEKRIVFLTDVAIFIMEQGSLRSLRAKSYFYKAFAVENSIYVLEPNQGLFRLRGNSLDPLPDGKLLAKEKIAVMLPYASGEILIGLRNGRLLLYRPESRDGEAISVPAQLQQAKTLLAEKSLYCGTMIDAQHYAIGTMENGIYVFARPAIPCQHLHRANGLMNNMILSLFLDREESLWAGMDNGLARIEINSPYAVIDERCGVSGRGLSAALLQKGNGADLLYLGTSDYLYFTELDRFPPEFVRVNAKSTQIFGLLAVADTVFCTNINGILAIKDKQIRLFDLAKQTYRLMPLRNRPNTLLLGTNRGFYLLKKNQAHWFTSEIKGFNDSCRYFSEDNDGSIWCSYEYRGIWNIRLSPQLDRVVSSRLYTSNDGLPDDSDNYLCYWHGGIVFFTRKGFYRFNSGKQRFEADSQLNAFLEANGEIQPAAPDAAGNLWFFENGQLTLLGSLPNGKLTVERTPYRKTITKPVSNMITPLDERHIIFDIPEGSMLLNPLTPKQYKLSFLTLLRSIENLVSHRKIYLGNGPLPSTRNQSVFPHRYNSLRFTYAAPYFEEIPHIEYRYYLEGFDGDWSGWSNRNQNEYTNIPAGAYTFHVQARNIYRTLGTPTQFHFRVLPPWYQTIPAYIAYVLGGALLLVGSVKWYTRRLKLEKVKLEKLVAQKTQELKEAALTDPLTGLRNRRFISEVLSADITAFVNFKKYLLAAKNRRAAGQNEKMIFGIFLIDIDHFKKVNDNWGHDAGDSLLKQFAHILRDSVRHDDAVLRIGGEEFLIILKRTLPEYLAIFADKIRSKIAETEFKVSAETRLRRTCSIGYTMFPLFAGQPTMINFDQTLTIADMALYYAKSHGRNRAIALFPGEKVPEEKEMKKITTSLDFGLEHHFFQLQG